jgi:hypothetical protein
MSHPNAEHRPRLARERVLFEFGLDLVLDGLDRERSAGADQPASGGPVGSPALPDLAGCPDVADPDVPPGNGGGDDHDQGAVDEDLAGRGVQVAGGQGKDAASSRSGHFTKASPTAMNA